MFKKGSPLRRRPSASMIVAVLALFVALSGGAYAAVTIPNNSVGFKQLRASAVGFRNLAVGSVGTRDLANKSVTNAKVANNAISYNQIKTGEIGHARVAQSQIQWRITGKCATAQAIQSVSDTGGVTCAGTLPTDYNTAGLSDPLTSSTTGTALAGESLPTGSAYQLTSTPYIQVNGTSGTQNVVVTCEILAGTVSETRSVTFALGTNHEQQAQSIPLSIDLPAQSSATEAAVACSRSYDASTAPTVQAQASLDAVQLAAINSVTTPGTSSTAFTLTTPTPTTTTTAATTTTGTTTTTTTATTS